MTEVVDVISGNIGFDMLIGNITKVMVVMYVTVCDVLVVVVSDIKGFDLLMMVMQCCRGCS